MLYFLKKSSQIISLFLVFSTVSNCTLLDKKEEKAEEDLLKKERFEPNVFKKAEESTKKGGSILFGKSEKKSEFAADNIIWQASLKALENIPLIQANYSGGVIITDWYNSNSSANSIKISIFINSEKLESASLDVKSFKKTCQDLKCSTASLNPDFNNEIKVKILNLARSIAVAQAKK